MLSQRAFPKILVGRRSKCFASQNIIASRPSPNPRRLCLLFLRCAQKQRPLAVCGFVVGAIGLEPMTLRV